MTIKLVVFDADKTLWSHPNVSNLTSPFRLVSRNMLADANGETFQLFDGIRELLQSLQTKKVIITIASWNKPEPVEEVLKLFEIDQFFKIVKAEFHPYKHLMIKNTISMLEEMGIKIRPNEILYVDDRTIHLEKTRETLGSIHFIQMRVDARTPREILEYVEKMENNWHQSHVKGSCDGSPET